jgi:hypothetical protein
VPHSSFFVEPLGLNLNVRRNGKELGRAEVVGVGTSKSADELKCHRERLVRGMDRCDLQLWEVKTLTEHVNTDDPIEFAASELCDGPLDRSKRQPAVDEIEAELRMRPVHFPEICGSVPRVCPHHQRVGKPRRAIFLKDEFGLTGNRDITRARITNRHRQVRDLTEDAILVGFHDRIRIDEAALDLARIATKRCGSE